LTESVAFAELVDMPISRVFQGKITGAQPLESEQALDWDSEHGWREALFAHHATFQGAVNYYLCAFAACATDPTGAAGRLRQQLRESWESFYRPSGEFLGIRRTLLGFLDGLTAISTAEDAFALILAGNEADDVTRQLALDSLLHDLGGEAAIQQGGRQYFPYFCQPTTKARFPRSAEALEKASGQAQLPAMLHAENAAVEFCAEPERLRFAWFANAQPGGESYSGAAVKAKLVEAAEWLLPKVGAGEALPEFEKRIGELLDENISFPRYTGGSIAKEALKRRFFAWLIFRFVEATPRTFAWLRDSFPKPKIGRTTKASAADDRATLEARLTSLGDDPIKLARGRRGYVFPAFTALPCWGAKDRGDVQWSEFDIAAFKEALKTLNQFRLKTEEREKERSRLLQFGAFIDGTSDSWGAQEPDEEPPGRLMRSDLRRELVARLVDELQPENREVEGEASHDVISRRARRGLRDVIEKWNQKVKAGERFSEAKRKQVKEVIAAYQAEHPETMGSATLFQKLTEESFWPLWQAPATEELARRQQEGSSEDPLRDYYEYCEAEAEAERLKAPIRFTPADPRQSRRLFMFSDLTGRSAARHVSGQRAIDVSIAVKDGDRWREARVRLGYSAPRLGRDHLQGAADEPGSVWLPPVLSAFFDVHHAPPQDFAGCAVALMPDWHPRQVKTPDGSVRIEEEIRYLLNLPMSLEVGEVISHFEKATRWKGQFNAMDDTLIHLHWPATMDPKKHEDAWWREGKSFDVLAIDLGQRFAVAAAILRAHRGEGHWEIGAIDGEVCRAKLLTLRDLRLQGEDARVLSDGQWRTEPHGSRGRLATEVETEEAKTLLRALSPNDAFADEEEKRFTAQIDSRFFPAQNDTLLRALRRAQGHLARYQRWAAALVAQKSLGDEWTEQDLKPEWKEFSACDELLQHVLAEIARLQLELPRHLVAIANRVAPLRGRSWAWNRLANASEADGRVSHRLDQTGPNRGKVWLRGQRGLSMKRIEQLEELRRRAQSLNRALQRRPGEEARFGRALAGDVLPDPCPALSDKLDRIKEQRINQTAHLILAEALGVEPRSHEIADDVRRERDIHAEYRRIPGREPVDFIVIEDLSRYRTSQGRAPSENSRLMKWCHRAVRDKLKELCEPFGIPVLETPPAYSSRFCSRSGVAGFRAVEVGPKDAGNFRWSRLLAQAAEKGSAAFEEAKQAQKLFELLSQCNLLGAGVTTKPRTLLAPQPGGPIFVPGTGAAPPMQADLNAAINLGLRAIAAPDTHRILVKIRTEAGDQGAFIPRLGNKRERASFAAQGKPAPIRFIEGDAENAGSLTHRATNFFVDLGELATFDRAEHPSFPGARLASGRGLWKSVKNAQWQRCAEINRRRIENWNKKAEEEDQMS
jgi:IS605 OrfB family transposase